MSVGICHVEKMTDIVSRVRYHDQFLLLDVDYVAIGSKYLGHARLRLFCRDTSNRRLVVIEVDDFHPYFYVTVPDNLEKQRKLDHILRKEPFYTWLLHQIPQKKKRYLGEVPVKVLKLVGRNPWMVPNLRHVLLKEGFEVHEADIPFNKRFLIDKGLYCLKKMLVRDYQTRGCYPSGITRLSSSHEDIFPVEDEEDLPRLLACALDIEVDDQGETMNKLIETASASITAISLAWGCHRGEMKKKVFWLASSDGKEEKRMIESFLDFFQSLNPDIVITFNGDVFDLPYLIQRMIKLGIDPRRFSRTGTDVPRPSNPHDRYYCPGLVLCDLVPYTWSIHPLSGRKTLDEVANVLLGERKVDITESSVGRLWRQSLNDQASRKTFLRYAARDAVLTYQLFHVLGIQDLILTLRVTGYPMAEGIAITSRNNGEFELFRRLHRKHVLIPPLPNDEELRQRLELKRKYPHHGGYVLNPRGSLYSCVIIADFRSMYPSIISAHNIGGESLRMVPGNFPEMSVDEPLKLFEPSPRSSLAELMDSLLAHREKVKSDLRRTKELLSSLKKKVNLDESLVPSGMIDSLKQKIVDLDRLQHSLKIVANSLYGAHNYPKGRFYQHVLANAITEMARNYIQQLIMWVADLSEELGLQMKVVYGDTDSVFIWIPGLFDANEDDVDIEKVLQLVKDILSRLNRRLPSKMQLEFEDVARRIVFKSGRKKSYAYKSLLTDRVIVKGFEAVRRDWSEPAKEAQRIVLDIILTRGSKGMQMARETVLQLVRELLNEPFRKPIDRKWIILGPLKRSPSEYKSKPPAVQAFLHYASVKHLDPSEEWRKFDLFPYVITLDGEKEAPMSQRARHPDLAFSIDKEFYVKQIIQAVNRFGLNITMEMVQGYGQRSTLDAYIF